MKLFNLPLANPALMLKLASDYLLYTKYLKYKNLVSCSHSLNTIKGLLVYSRRKSGFFFVSYLSVNFY